MNQGVFFLASLVFSDDRYQIWLKKNIFAQGALIDLPDDYADSDIPETTLGKNATVKKYLDFFQKQHEAGNEFREFEYDVKSRKFSMKAYFSDYWSFANWMKVFAFMVALAASMEVDGYGVFINDAEMTSTSCHYLFVSKGGKVQTFFYDFYDSSEKWAPFKKVWNQKVWQKFNMPFRAWSKLHPRHNYPDEYAGKYGFIDLQGNMVIPPIYPALRPFFEGLAAAQDPQSFQWGFIDEEGKWVIAPAFSNVGDFCGGLAIVTKKITQDFRVSYLSGLIDKAGKMVVEPKYIRIENLADGRAMVTIDGKKGFFDQTGKLVIPAVFDEAGSFQCGRAVVMKGPLTSSDVRYGYIDVNGKMIVDFNFLRGWHFCEGFAPVLTEKGWGFLKTDGSFLVDPQFEEVSYFQNGFAKVKLAGQWGIVDINGLIKIPSQFDDVPPFREGKALVKQKGLWGIIDVNGKFLVEPTFDYSNAGFLKNGMVYTEKGGRYGLITAEGTVLFEPQFEMVYGSGEKLILVKFPKS